MNDLRKTHAWAHPISLAYIPAAQTAALEQIANALMKWLKVNDSTVDDVPTNLTDVIFTTARFGSPVSRKDALFFQAKRRFGLSHRPDVWTLVEIRESEYQRWSDHFVELAQLSEDALPDYQYPGLGPQAAQVLLQQAKRGGPEVAIGRFLQAHVKSLRVMALHVDDVGRPLKVVQYDLAGAHPTTPVLDLDTFAQDAGLRLLTATCAHTVNKHVFLGDPLPRATWDDLQSPAELVQAGPMFTKFGFFTSPVLIEKLLGFRGLSGAISAQFSEGCYAVFDPDINELITTATGSSRLVDKRLINRTDQAIVTGVKPQRDGVIVRAVEGMEKVIPSVEAVEMRAICDAVSKQQVINTQGQSVEVPAVRAILHGHIGVASYNPAYVESVQLEPLYYAHLVSCGTGPLADETAAAFARSESLGNAHDPRAVIFIEQPGHGTIVVEKWLADRPAFQTMQDYLKAGHFRMSMDVPQGRVEWETVTLPDGTELVQKSRLAIDLHAPYIEQDLYSLTGE